MAVGKNELADLETEAIELHETHDSDPEDPVPPDELCRRVLGSTPELCEMRGDADLSWFDHRWVVRVSVHAPEERRGELIAHEVAEGVLTLSGYVGALNRAPRALSSSVTFLSGMARFFFASNSASIANFNRFNVCTLTKTC